MDITFIITMLFIGSFAGLVVGLTGVGATLILLPSLIILLPKLLPNVPTLKIAIATTLACAAVSVITAAVMHYRRGNVHKPLFKFMACVYLVTALIGPTFVHFFPEHQLRVLVGIILILIAVYVLFKPRVAHISQIQPQNKWVASVVTTLAGFVNSMLGIGTGNIMIPYLSRHYPFEIAKGVSLAAASISSGLATVVYIISGLHVANLPRLSLGYVYLPAFIVLSIAIFVMTQVGVHLSVKINQLWIKLLLCVMVLAAGLNLLIFAG